MPSKFREKMPAILLPKPLIIALVLAFSLLAGTVAGAAGAASPGSSQKAATRIVAFGDSITAGYENGMDESSVPYGYVEQVFGQALFRGSASYTNYGLLGLRSEGFKLLLEGLADGRQSLAVDAVQSDLESYDFRAAGMLADAAGMRQAAADANLFLITIGGNDLSPLINQFDSGGFTEEALATAMNHIIPNVRAGLQALHQLNPDARIILANQYNPVPNGGPIFSKFEPLYLIVEQSANTWHEQLVLLFAELREEGIQAEVVDLREPFAGKAAQLTSILKQDIHPSASGYKQIAAAFTRSIWNEEVLAVAPRAEGANISVVLDGTEYINKFGPILRNWTTFVPLREISEAMGATIKWDQPTLTATYTLGERIVKLQVGSKTMTVNGKPVAIAQAPFLEKFGKENKTYVPLAVLADGLGFQVQYVAQTKIAFVNRFAE